MKILIVEDDLITRNCLAEHLKQHNAKVKDVDCSLMAIQALETDDFDCILVDLGLPDLDGIQLIKKIRYMGIKSKIIVASGYDERDILFRCVSAGANHYLIKPIDYERLDYLIFDI